MAVISVNLTDTFEQWRTKTNSLATKQGDLTTLTTTAKSTVVAAINEVDAAGSFANVVEDTSPQLGGNLDVLARSITTSTTNGNIAITPHGSGNIVLDGLTFPNADGTANYFLKTNGSSVLAFAQVPTAGIAADAITGAQLADNACDSEHYTDGSIDTAHIANDQITAALIADNAIDSDMYVDGSIDTAHLAADAVDGTKLADNACDSEHYTDGSVDNVHLATGIDAAKLTTGTLPMARLSGTLPALNGSALTTLSASNISAGTLATARLPATCEITTLDLGNWTITESGGVLFFATGGTNKMKLDASGNLTVVANVTAYGSM